MQWWTTGLDERRLALALALFFLAFSLPAFLLAWRAWEQGQWQVFHGYRLQAEALSARVDDGLRQRIASEDARAFGDYAYLARAGAERSPLARYPVAQNLPGVLGYFQVDSAGQLSTPLLPAAGMEAAAGVIDSAEYRAREQLAARLRSILAGPDTVLSGRRDQRARAVAGGKDEALADDADMAENATSNVFERLTQSDEARFRQRAANSYGKIADLKLDARLEKKSIEQNVLAEQLPRAPVRASSKRESRKEQVAVLESEVHGFEALEADRAFAAPSRAAKLRRDTAAPAAALDLPGEFTVKGAAVAGNNPAGAVRDDSEAVDMLARARSAPSPQTTTAAPVTPPVEPAPGRRLRLFESEIDPMTFEWLDAEHFVLFRNVWRDGSRYVQGAVIEQRAFIDGLLVEAWRNSALADMSNLVVALQGEVLRLASGAAEKYPARAGSLRGELLYRTRLSAPLAELELIYSVTELPLGASVRWIGWVTLALIVTLAGGCYTIFRFAREQMRLYRQQQDFISAVSHELKTPLTSIRMYAEMLKAGWASEERKASYYEFIHDESERLSRLINNVLQLARMTRGPTRLERKAVTLGALCATVHGKIATQVEHAGFELVVTIDQAAENAVVDVDADAVVQILINFVDNAIKFTPASAPQRIEFAARRQRDGSVRISVRDYGRGVPRAQMRRIFELFYRAENELTRDTVGTGIGLALVRELAQAMDGKVDVSNCEPGAEFSLQLPARNAAPTLAATTS